MKTLQRTAVISDYEGPWSTVDYADALTKSVIPNADRLFKSLSNYIVYLINTRPKEGYQPGYTLALAAPILIAYDVNEDKMKTIAKESARFVPGTKEAIGNMQQQGPFWIVSTGYKQYVDSTAPLVGIPLNRTRSTPFPIEELKQNVREDDKRMVREIAQNITRLPPVGVINSEKDVTPEMRVTIDYLGEFLWRVLPQTSLAPTLESVKPMGGERKVMALREILKEEKVTPRKAVGVGDSFTDVDMLKWIADAGGLSISFNGNNHALKSAMVAITASDTHITPVITQIYARSDIREVEHVTRNWSASALREEVNNGYLDQRLLDSVMKLSEFPMAYWLTKENFESVKAKSLLSRTSVRGEDVSVLA